MAKRLNTSVHFGDPETGENRVFVAGSKLSRADTKALTDAWGDRAEAFFTDDGEDDLAPEERPLQETSPQADRVPSDPATPQVEEAMKVNVDARENAPAPGTNTKKTGQAGNAAK